MHSTNRVELNNSTLNCLSSYLPHSHFLSFLSVYMLLLLSEQPSEFSTKIYKHKLYIYVTISQKYTI